MVNLRLFLEGYLKPMLASRVLAIQIHYVANNNYTTALASIFFLAICK